MPRTLMIVSAVLLMFGLPPRRSHAEPEDTKGPQWKVHTLDLSKMSRIVQNYSYTWLAKHASGGYRVIWKSNDFALHAVLRDGKFGEVQAVDSKEVRSIFVSPDRRSLIVAARPKTIVLEPKVSVRTGEGIYNAEAMDDRGWLLGSGTLWTPRGERRLHGRAYGIVPIRGLFWIATAAEGGGLSLKPIEHKAVPFTFPAAKHEYMKAFMENRWKYGTYDLLGKHVYCLHRREEPLGVRVSLLRLDTNGKLLDVDLAKGLNRSSVWNDTPASWIQPFADGAAVLSYFIRRPNANQDEKVLELVLRDGTRRALSVFPKDSDPGPIWFTGSNDGRHAIVRCEDGKSGQPMAQIIDSEGRPVGPLFKHKGTEDTVYKTRDSGGTFDSFLIDGAAALLWRSKGKIHVATLELTKR